MIKVLIIDDSLFMRELLKKGLDEDPNLKVVGTAADPYEAKEKIIKYRPDVLTLDIEMPKMDGITFLHKLMPQYPLPVVMLSSVTAKVFEALNAGAIDFIEKPTTDNRLTAESLLKELRVKIKIASTADVSHWKSRKKRQVKIQKLGNTKGIDLIAIGASTGGTEAISDVIKTFPADIPGTVIVQHMPPVFTGLYADRMNKECVVEVKEAKTGDLVLPGRVLIAPGGYHLQIKKSGASVMVEVINGGKVNGHKPSVDVLFNSVAKHIGRSSLGVILTGMGADGARGLLAMRKAGARTLGQDRESSVVYGMPKVAKDIGGVERELPLQHIPSVIFAIVRGKR
jgi:two-component system chemotaxis response regulator CheB